MKKYSFPKNKWFFELGSDVPYDSFSEAVGVPIIKCLYRGKSKFQKIEFYATRGYGKILVLDGVIQTSEKDEFIYHEMLCHPPVFLHPNPKKILIIGGGDGGILKEALKHQVDEVTMVEIDKKVIDLCQKYLPSISRGAYQDIRTKLVIGDGQVVVKKQKNYFDVVILDLSDPEGPAKELISNKFYQSVKEALTMYGTMSVQSGSLEVQQKMPVTIYQRIKKIFPYSEIHKAVVPAYHAGEYSFVVGSKINTKGMTLARLKDKFKKTNLALKYYSPEIHFSSQVLPKYLSDKLDKKH